MLEEGGKGSDAAKQHQPGSRVATLREPKFPPISQQSHSRIG
jgi:hypothetical protein